MTLFCTFAFDPLMYKKAFTFLTRFLHPATLYRWGFNFSPMYRRTTGRITSVSKDLSRVEVQIPLSWRNVNYVGSIFGGSMLSATDPILMIQLMQILGDDFIVWDKQVQMRFKRPARSRVYVVFEVTLEEIEHIKSNTLTHGEMNWDKPIVLRSKDDAVIAEATKTVYIATKAHYRAKRDRRAESENQSGV